MFLIFQKVDLENRVNHPQLSDITFVVLNYLRYHYFTVGAYPPSPENKQFNSARNPNAAVLPSFAIMPAFAAVKALMSSSSLQDLDLLKVE